MVRETRLRRLLTEGPRGLSALRIVVAGLVLLAPELHAAPALAQSPEQLVGAPEGLGWMAQLKPDPSWVSALRVIAVTSGALALLGYCSRVACAVLMVSAGLLISFTQRSGAVLHDMHLLWLLALLAASPAGDAWSLDAWGQPSPAASVRYGVPLACARALLGAVYFFPGLHKLLAGQWASAENLAAILHAKWFQYQHVPLLRVDREPVLLTLGGVSVIAFELCFGALALWPKTRRLALLSGLAFHFATHYWLRVSFPSLWLCYVVLLPWDRVVSARKGTLARGEEPLPRGSLVVGATLLLAVSIQGARGRTQAYPFACYPTFAEPASDVAPDLIVELVTATGETRRLQRQPGQPRAQAEWGRVYALSGAYGDVASDAQLLAFAREQLRRRGWEGELQRARFVRFWLADYATRPDAWGEPPRRTQLLRELVF